MSQRVIWTGVGRRKTPAKVLGLCTTIAHRLTELGGYCRTGDALGADRAFSQGVDRISTDLRAIYSAKTEEWCRRQVNVLHSQNVPTWNEAEIIAKAIHPNWGACSTYVKALHTRNVFQVIGEDLNSPSEFLICWSKPTGPTTVEGGTNTAVQVAHDWKIPVYNLYYEEIARWLWDAIANDNAFTTILNQQGLPSQHLTNKVAHELS